MNKKNYQKIMEDLIRENCTAGEAPSLLLHSCCAPCSSYCIACLAEHFHVTVFYYNPNIYPPEEYHMRAKEQERFIAEFPTKYPVTFVEGAYDTQRFYDMAKEAASYAKAHGFDFFTTTLSISPLKNAEKLNQIGAELADTFDVRYLFSDFKKKEGYKKSTEISKEYHMYRQYYCGCVYSKRDRDREIVLRRQQEEQIL